MKFQNPFFGAKQKTGTQKYFYRECARVMRQLAHQASDVRITRAINPDIHVLLDKDNKEIGVQWFDGEREISKAIHIYDEAVMKEVKKNIVEFIENIYREKHK